MTTYYFLFSRTESVSRYVLYGRFANAIPSILERFPLRHVYFPRIRYSGMMEDI